MTVDICIKIASSTVHNNIVPLFYKSPLPNKTLERMRNAI